MASVSDPQEQHLSLTEQADMLREVKRMAKQRPDGVIPRNEWLSVYQASKLRSEAHHKANTGDVKGAIDLYNRSIEKDPHPSSAYYQIGKLYMTEKDYKAALPWIETTVKMQPTHYNAHSDAAKIKTELGDVAGAAQHHEYVLQYAPSHRYNGASAARHRSRMALGKPKKQTKTKPHTTNPSSQSKRRPARIS